MNARIVINDYKHVFIIIDIIAVIMVIANALLNVLNLGNILYLYIAHL